MSLSFYRFFCTYLFYNPLYLCSYLISQRLRPSVVLLQLLSSSFHSKLLLLPFLTVKSPPSTSIFFFLYLSWSNNLYTTSTNLHHKNHKNQNPQAWTSLTHKHWSLPLASIHKHKNPFPSTHKHQSPPPTLIHKHPDPFLSTHELWSSPTNIDPPIHKQPTPALICLSVGLYVWLCLCVGAFVCICV